MRKRRRTTIMTIMILFILASVGVVSGETQGYEVFYHGKSLGYVHTTSVFKSAVDKIEGDLAKCYNYDNIHLGEGFQLIPARVENPMDQNTCIEVLKSTDIALYVDGAVISLDGQEIGTMISVDEAQNLIAAFQEWAGDKNIGELTCSEKKVPLADTKDFSTVWSILKER
jgi:hypothetical protein